METGINKQQIVQAKYQIKEYLQLIISILILVVGLLLFLFVIRPAYAKYQTTKVDIEMQVKEESLLDIKLTELQKAKELQSSIDENIRLTDQAVSDESEIPTVMAMTQQIALNSGVKVTSFTYVGLSESDYVESTTPTTSAIPSAVPAETKPTGLDVSVDSEVFDAFNLSISVLGKVDNLTSFVKNVEDSRRLLDISGFTYSVEKESEEITSDFYTLRIQLTSYYKSFENAPPRVALNQYTDTISSLKKMKFTEIDLTNSRIGKDDPFKTGTSPNLKSTDGQNFFNNDSTGTPPQNSGSNSGEDIGINVIEPEQDVEASEGDVQKLLLELIQQEGLQ